MARNLGLTALITGANVGIGKDVARQLAASGAYNTVYLACRNRGKAEAAKRDLEAARTKTQFRILQVDVSRLDSVRAMIASLPDPADDLVMNAGGSGGLTPFAINDQGVTDIFASNVLGHVAMLEGLVAAGKLRRAAVFAGSEAARGVPKLGMKRPVLATGSADEFASLIDGSFFQGRKQDLALAYGQTKYVAALWMAAAARRHPELRLITISPGNTAGTEGMRDLSATRRFIMRYVVKPILPAFGLMHPVDRGAKRLVDGLTSDALRSGVFYASEARTLTGPVVDQSVIVPDFADPTFQDHASEAIHRFI